MAGKAANAEEQSNEKREVEASHEETRRKLDDIQRDIDKLMENLNVFMSDSLDSSDDDVSSEHETTDGQNYNKERFDWGDVQPIMENIMGDLERLQALNKDTNNVVRRINEFVHLKCRKK